MTTEPAAWHSACTCGIAAGWSLMVEHDETCPFGQQLAGLLNSAEKRGAERVGKRVESTLRLISPDHITPLGARQIRVVLVEEKGSDDRAQ